MSPSVGRAQCPPNCPVPAISLSTSTMLFTTPVGGVPKTQGFAISNPIAGTTLQWSLRLAAITGPNWLFASPTSGVGDANVTVSVNSGSLRAGTYTASLQVVAQGASNSPQTLNVTLVVGNVNLTLNPASFLFAGSPGITLLAQQLSIASSGIVMPWSATVSTSSGGNWLAISEYSGQTPAFPTVSVNTTGMPAGTYEGSITVSAEHATNGPQTAKVTLALGTPVISLKPSQLVFGVSLGSSVSPQGIDITNAGSGALVWTAFASTSSGGNWLSVIPTSATAPSTVSVAVNSTGLLPGVYSGSVTIVAAGGISAANSPQVVPVTFAVEAPAVQPGAIVNGASFSTEAVLSPGAIASIFGINLAPATASAVAESSPVVLPTALAETQVLVNGTPAPLFYVSPRQINFQLPHGLQESAVAVTVISKEIRGVTTDVKLEPQAPGVFFTSTGQGIVLNQDFSLNSAGNPAAPGSVIQVYATGLGATDPPAVSGQGAGASPLSLTLQTPTVLVGGSPAEVLFSGLAPGFVGLYQVNVRLPAGIPLSSAVPLQIQSATRKSNTVTIAVR